MKHVPLKLIIPIDLCIYFFFFTNGKWLYGNFMENGKSVQLFFTNTKDKKKNSIFLNKSITFYYFECW